MPDKRHVQRSRDWRRRHREDVYALAKLLDLLLVRDAEALFLVDHQQSEIAELHVLRQQAVRADDDVELSGVQVVEDLLLLAFAAEATDHVDADRKAGKPLAQSLLVLKREHGGGCEKRHLFAVHYRLERGAHRHFRLAVSDVAAEQTIHRDRRFHVPLDVGDRGHLIGRQLVRKRVLEFLLPVRVGGKGMAAHRLSRRVELQQLLGHVAHGLLHAGLGLLPGGAAKAIDWRPRRAGVLLDEIEPLDRHEQLVLAGVAQLHELLRRFARPRRSAA